MAREAVWPANPHALFEQHRYSPAVRSGNLLFVSGQVGAGQDGSPEPDLERQVQLASDNLNAILIAADCSFEDVVDAMLFIVDPESNFETIWPVLQANWGEQPYTPVTAVGATWLGGFDFESKATARIPGEVRNG